MGKVMAPLGAVFSFVVVVLESAPVRAEVPVIVVSPYVVATPIARAGSTVSVIGRSEIEKSSPGTVAELLRSVPGLDVGERGGPGGRTLVSLRGAEAQHTLVMLDGVRVNDPASARFDFDFAQLSLNEIERIEVLKGPQSAIYGSDAMGGVINIITRRPARGHRTSATVEGGTYGTRAVSGSFNGGKDGLRLLFSGSYFASDGFSRVGDRDHGEPDATEKYAGTVRLGADLGGRNSVELGVDGHRQMSDIDKSATTDAAGYDSNRDLVSGFGRFSFASEDSPLTNTVTVFVARSTRSFGEPTRTTYYAGGSLGAEYQGNVKLGKHGSLLVGLRAEQEDAYSKRTDKAAPSYDAERSLFAGYLLYQLPLGNLNLSFAGRHDGEADGEGFTTGRMTAVYDFPAIETKVRGSLGTGAKRPTAFQLSYNGALEPETSIGADLGLEKFLFDGRATLSVTGFWNRFNNLIDWDGDFLTGTYKNVAEAETAGIEMAATARIVPGRLSAKASYTYLHSRDLATGLPLQRRTMHSGKVSLTYTGIDRLTARLSATLVGERYDDDAAIVLLDPYTRVDARADYRLNDTTTVFARIENLLDADYQEIGGYNTAGFSAYAGLTWQN